jgi:hypothetical protein
VDADTLCTPVHLGGLGLVDVADKTSAFRFQYIQRYLTAAEDAPRRAMTAYHLTKRATRFTFYASLKDSWTMMGVMAADGNGRPVPAGWPPPSDVLESRLVLTGEAGTRSLPIEKREIYGFLRSLGKVDVWPLKGRHTDDVISWARTYDNSSFGRYRDVAWRPAHDRWADAIFLHRAGMQTRLAGGAREPLHPLGTLRTNVAKQRPSGPL